MSNTSIKRMDLPTTIEGTQIQIDLLTDKIIKCEQQLLEAKGRDTYSDPVWFSRTNAALRISRAQRQKLTMHLATLKRAERKIVPHNSPEHLETERTFEREFMAQAKRLLTVGQYRILIEAVYIARPDLPR